VVLALCLVILSACGGTAGSGEGRVPSASGESPVAQAGLITAVVREVIDGDTFRAVLAGGREEKVRLIGVDAPESTKEVEPYGKEAAAYTRKRLSGRTVYLELDVGERDKYGRLLAYVWLDRPQSGSEDEARAKMYNAELLLVGLAQVMTVPPNVKYAELFVKLQQEAREAKKGLWAADRVSIPGRLAGSGPWPGG
jgi:micrococcal nuclease